MGKLKLVKPTAKKVVTKKLIKTKNQKRKVLGSKVSKPKKFTRELGKTSVDDFLSNILENDDIDVSETSDNTKAESPTFSMDESDDDLNEEDLAEKHKHDLEKLKKTDPEFYSFLQANDKKLLEFNLSDEEENKDTVESEDEEVHKPDNKLEVASDESDFEEDEEHVKDDKLISLKMIKKWQTDIQTDKSNKTISELTQAFHAALNTISAPDEDNDQPSIYKVEGSAVFNAIIQLCVLELGPAILRFLGLKQGSKQPPHKCKKFNKIKRVLKSYFVDLLKLLLGVTSANIQSVLLKHLHYMSSLLASFQCITKSIAKRLIVLWSTAEDSVRVLAFFCILRITNNQIESLLETVLKSMYMSYVKNSKFVSLNSLAAINFMRRSLVEMFALDVGVSYSQVFLYIRQLAIHLRNAITVKKKENIQAVCNWQFVNSLRLWGSLLAVTNNKHQMQQLIYPFVQVCLGTIKLVPTPQYYPLRFHIVQILIDLSRDTGVFIPVLPFLLEVLTSLDFDKKHQKVSMKPMHFTCLLRLSKSQMQENGFKDMVIETIYGQLLEYLSTQSHTVAFPDLSLICIVQMKQFLKKCKTVNYTRKMKQILEKVEKNCKFIEDERSKLTLNLTDFKQMEGWESQIQSKGTPLTIYYDEWNKLRNIKKNKQLTNNEQLGEYNLPAMKKNKKAGSKKSEGPVELFPSDSESAEESKVNTKRKARGKRGGKKGNKKIVDKSGPIEDTGEKDLVQDLKMDEW